MSKPTCVDCRFLESSPYEIPIRGECRRLPPQIIVFPATSETEAYKEVVYPEVGERDWCGEHQPKEIIVQCNRCGEDLRGREDMPPGYKPLCVTCGQRLMAEKEALAK